MTGAAGYSQSATEKTESRTGGHDSAAPSVNGSTGAMLLGTHSASPIYPAMARLKFDEWWAGWPERLKARDDAFIQRFGHELETLAEMGYDDREIMCAVGGRLYVRKWANCPRWLEALEALPGPLKWSDGVKYRRPKKPTIQALVREDVLFLKYRADTLVGHQKDIPWVLAVHDLRARTLPELVDGLPNGADIEFALTEIARTHGLRLTNNLIHFTKQTRMCVTACISK